MEKFLVEKKLWVGELSKSGDTEDIIGYGINCSYGSEKLINLIEQIA